MIDATRNLLHSLIPQNKVEETGNFEQFTFILPWPTEGDYRFIVDIHGEEEAWLSAVRRGAERNEYFWYHPFEDAAFPTPEALFQQLHRELRLVLENSTRITQTRGMFMWSFTCEYNTDRGWKELYTHGLLRWNNGVPPISGKRHVYSAPPIAASPKEMPNTR